MGEGKKDHTAKRHRHIGGLGKSSSDSELAHGPKAKERWPFVEGLTVDELARYRRRPVPGHPKDTLCRPEGRFKNIISEYRRAFRASSEDIPKENISPVGRIQPDDFLKLEDSSENVVAQRGEFKDRKVHGAPARRNEPTYNFLVADGDSTSMETQTESSKFVPHMNANGRPALIRRGTSLKREGSFLGDTEQSRYVAHEGYHRADLARRPTSLRMEGEMDTMTEKCEKFIEWLNVSRPELMRIPTNLKLEGDLETTTESHEKYVPFVGARRPELLRQSANLKMEGESRYVPEYKEVFKEHDVQEKRMLKKPESHLRTEGNFYQSTETSEKFANPRFRQMQLDADTQIDNAGHNKEMKKEDEMKQLVSRLEDLQGPPLEIPEYRDSFKDFPRERPKLIKPEDEIGRADGSKISTSTTPSKFQTKIDMDPEYKSKFLDLSKERPIYRKPPLGLRTSGSSHFETSPERYGKSACFNRTGPYEGHGSNFETSEVRSQYVSYGQIPRVETIKMPANLRLEGNIDLQPEYRNAYCGRRDYHVPTGEPRMHRRRDRSISASRKRDNHWTHNSVEKFGGVNGNEDQDAFQVLRTRVREESVIGKPPSGSQRGSRSSHIQVPTQLDYADASVLRNRSPSPSYRLHVCNVDDEPRGFGRRKRSPSSQSTRVRNQSPDTMLQSTQRPYSPSFARESHGNGHQVDKQSFVVLDNNGNRDAAGVRVNEAQRRRTDKNCNADSQNYMPRGRPRNKTPPNWMPPWYDTTNTI